MKRFLRYSALGLVAVLFLLAVAGFWYRNASLPKVSGKLQVSGLVAPVDVVRDAEGVPHIYAQSPRDAHFTLGFVHAQDRLWQMEMNRRIVAGRMAETLGASALDTDRFLRTLGVRRNAEKIYNNLSPDMQAVLQAYADGVNAYLAQRRGPLPPEFLLTGAPAPEKWEPADSIGWQTMMAWDLGGNWTQEVLRMRLAQLLPVERINEFLAPYPGEQVPQTMDYTALYRELVATSEALVETARLAPPSYIDGMGSNNWVVSGGMTDSGLPLLANDPHLGLSAPALWYFAHLSAPGLNVIGATLPGMPGIVLGRNDHIAWGFTNTGPDVQDLYIERINPDDETQYQTPDGWAAFNTRTETIKVKGGSDVDIVVRETRHGPVITGAHAVLGKTGLAAQRHVVSFAWTALRDDDLTIQAGMKINQAKNWEEFLEGVRDFSAPQQSMVYADDRGNIGFVAPGRIPLRKPENDLKGLAPAPGWDGKYDWDGFLPFEQLPRILNPATERLMSANQRIVAPEYPHFLTSEWHLPYRADRINALLDAKQRHSLASFTEIQMDHVSLAARDLLPVMLQAEARSSRSEQAIALLEGWNGSMDADAAAPLIFNAWLRVASLRIFADELGEPLLREYWEQKNVHQSTLNVLKNVDGQARWCGNASKPESNPEQLCASLLTDALEEALDDLVQRYGENMARWKWGDAHFARSEHRPFGRVPALSWLFDLRVPTPGDAFTVNVGRFNMRDTQSPFANRHAASLRAVYDMANPEHSRFMHSTGQSGHVLSPLYRNFSGRWAQGESIPMQMQRSVVEQGQRGTLQLMP